jgi:hypothetical protein
MFEKLNHNISGADKRQGIFGIYITGNRMTARKTTSYSPQLLDEYLL